MPNLPTILVPVTLTASLLAQSNCAAGPSPAATLATLDPFNAPSLYGHPNYPTLPGPSFPGFSFLFDVQLAGAVDISRIDVDLYDDGGAVQVSTTVTVTSPNQVGATAPVTIFLCPAATWMGQETMMGNWAPLGTGTLTVAPHHTDSQMIFNPPVNLPAGNWGIAVQVPQTTNGPNPGPLHPMVDPNTAPPPAYVGTPLVITNLMFQRESWTNALTSLSHTQSLEFHYQGSSDYADWTSFGAGCGPATPPTLGLSDRPVIGTTVDFTTTGISAGAQLAFTLFGFAPDPAGTSLAPFGLPGCAAYLSLAAPPIVTVAPVVSGAAALPLALPNSASYSGVVLYAQSAPLLGGNPVFEVSNAICVGIGLY